MSWKMNPVHCRTTFDPILKNSLQDVVDSGSLGEELDIMLPKGAQLYNKGWVLDLGESEKKAKKKLERYGGLGYIDSKKAYYGIHASGPLRLFIPCVGREDISKMQKSSGDVRLKASKCFQTLVLCEVNEKHTGKECDLNHDLSFLVGGVKPEKVKPINATGTSYWGRNICIHVEIPSESVISKKEDSDNGIRLGISLEIAVNSTSVIIHSGPCSLSHVVWEQVE